MPRIGPVSDFYGSIVLPSPGPCSGLITNPITSDVFLATTIFYPVSPNQNNYTIGTTQKVGVMHRVLGGSAVVNDSLGWADFANDSADNPAGAAGYYNLKAAETLNIANAGGGILTLRWRMNINSVPFYEVVYTQIGSNGSKYIYMYVPFFYLAVGDVVTITMTTAITGGGWIVGGLAGTENTRILQMYYLGT